jgi:PBSX family phage terminase large subunit
MKIDKISEKQAQILDFVVSDDLYLICDGAVRSGKTVFMSAAFVIWAMEYYDRTNFAICGKTVQSAERNVLKPLQENESLPYTMSYKVSTKVLTVRCGTKENYFYIFGGKDESSYMLIQGITLAGVLFDEVALMPRSFVEQALSRAISFEYPKYWFNCNPESPNHYFYKEWLENQKDGTTHLHFLLEDNPILTPQMIERTKAMYSGVFYDRYIRGLWVIAEGIIYPMFGKDSTVPTIEREYSRYVISMDYGIQNPTAILLWGFCDGVWYQVDEYYHSGRETSQQKTDQEYYENLEKLAGDRYVDWLIIDPSATSFITLVKQKRRFRVKQARNDVIDGIQKTASAIQQGKIKVNDCCKRTIKEYGLYSWDQKADEDRPIKDNDHAMDATRYFVSTMQIMKPKSDYRSLLD